MYSSGFNGEDLFFVLQHDRLKTAFSVHIISIKEISNPQNATFYFVLRSMYLAFVGTVEECFYK